MNLPRITLRNCLTAALSVVGLVLFSTSADAQNFGFRQPAVGGVMVDASGVVRSATPSEKQAFLTVVRANVLEPQGELTEESGLRMISLKGLQQAILEAMDTGEKFTDDIRYLAGLRRVDYVFVDPSKNDIVIAGPAEPWTILEDGSAVGVDSGMPMMVIDDLVTAMQSVERSRNEPISCSIEPTEEGVQRLNRMLSGIRLRPGQDPRSLEGQMKQAFGLQEVKLTGVPADSNYARVMVAADYQMKRIAMGLEPSGLRELPSYIEMARNTISRGNANPRWWMACDYNSLSHSEDRLSWQLSGRRIKTMTETDLRDASGQVVGREKANPKAQQWADMMTDNFDALTERFPVFGQMRNVIDLSVVATLIVQQGLEDRAGVNLDVLLGRSTEFPVSVYTAPTKISPECSFLRGRSGWVVTASGGVDVNAFEIVSKMEPSQTLGAVRSKSLDGQASTWWWNG